MIDAKDPKNHNENKDNDGEAIIKQKIYDSCYFFIFPFILFSLQLHWDILLSCIQELEDRVERDDTKWVEHCEDHPSVNHLDGGSHRQRLGYANKTKTRLRSIVFSLERLRIKWFGLRVSCLVG